MPRSLKDYGIISLKGMAMGAADVVPGVSGGTIAFISGIYEEFIDALKSIDLKAIKKIKAAGLMGFWRHINGAFLLALFIGIGISIVSLAKGIQFLLANYPILLWAFFFGLIVASALMIGGTIKKWGVIEILGLLAGTAIAYWITIASPAETPTATWFIFLSGMIAICAMILPGISGSFILLLLGKYAFIIGAVAERNITILGTFAGGCIVGLLSFSHILSWMFKKFPGPTIALLTGFMIGSLNKVWPWKITTQWTTNSHGEEIPLVQQSLWPGEFQGEVYLWPAMGLALLGFLLIVLLERLAPKEHSV